MKRLESLIDEIREALEESVYEALHDDMKTAYATIDTNDGYIEAAVPKKTESVSFYIFHDNDSDHECPRLAEYLKKEFCNDCFWTDAEKELEEQNKIDQGLDPAFSSWEDYYNYRFG